MVPVLRIKPPRKGDVRRAVDQQLTDAFDHIQRIMAEEGAEAVLRIQFEGFGPVASPTQLQVRSGEALASMASDTDRLGPTHVRTTIGALNASPEIEQYLETQELGRTITPRYAEKLAFPPGDAGWPIRDERGVQMFWRSEFMEAAEEYGFAYVWDTDTAVLGRQEGSREIELLFIRADEVTIPPRRIIGRQEKPTRDAIRKRIVASFGK